MGVVMRSLRVLAVLLCGILAPVPSIAQSDEVPRYGFCWLEIGFTRHVSGIVQLRKDDFYKVLVPSFRAYLEANQGTARNAYCYNEAANSTSANAEMTRIIDGNPHVTFVRTGWTEVLRAIEVAPRAESRPVTIQSGVRPQSVPEGPTPNQLKYQRELEAYNARLAVIEKIKADTAAKHAADKSAAEQELARHRQQLAVAENAKRQYAADLAAHQQRVRAMETKKDREAKLDWREAVVVCMLNASDGQARFGNWRCDGPLQMTYAKLGNPGQALATEALVPLSQACGGSRDAVRDLGMVGDARLFGCSYGIHPKSTSGFPLDAAAKHGIGFVPGRAIYRCPAYNSGCRTQ